MISNTIESNLSLSKNYELKTMLNKPSTNSENVFNFYLHKPKQTLSFSICLIGCSKEKKHKKINKNPGRIPIPFLNFKATTIFHRFPAFYKSLALVQTFL